MRRRGSSCRTSGSRSGNRRAPPSCTSPTTSRRPSTWPIASWCCRARPSRVLAEIVVPLKRPRTEAMQAEPGYLETVERIWSLITYAGVRQADPLLIRAAVSFGAGRLSVIRKVVLPSALPMIFAGLKLGAGTALLLLVAAEMIAADSGIGFLVLHAGNIMDTTKLMVGIVCLSLLGVLSHWLLTRGERLAVPWRHT